MNTYIVLLRGVNVGGKNLLPMKELRSFMEEAGFNNVKTYIQSGNIILTSRINPESNVGKLIKSKFGFLPVIHAISKTQFSLFAEKNPYKNYEGKFVHFYFCKDASSVNYKKVEEFLGKDESYELIDNVFYLHAPSGIGRSKLVANIDACLGISTTGRNLNTINKLVEMVSAV